MAWFLCPYVRVMRGSRVTRVCAMDAFTAAIRADGGDWRETEILGDRALVKVRASPATLVTMAGTAGFRRIPLNALNDPLSALTPGQRTAIRTEILDAGYSVAELTAALPDLSVVTLRQVLQFLASRRVKPRYDQSTDTLVFDGPVMACCPVDDLDREVS
jgi:hypothetical protein